MKSIRQTLGKINISGSLRFDEPMSAHTSYRVGGPADAYAVAATIEDVMLVRELAGNEDIPLFPLGAGANILVADKGIRGIVVDTSALSDFHISGNLVYAAAGVPMSDASHRAMRASLGGLEFIYAMPGSVGGSVWMNARCYGRSIADVLSFVDVLDESNREARVVVSPEEFSYKHSPFMETDQFILGAGFQLKGADQSALREEMESHKADREKKGHFSMPCAGSVFKNNREFGVPTGKLIDELGLKNYRIGGAMVSPLHGNIIVNTGDATSTDLLRLIEHVENVVREKRGHILEREVIPVGDWN